MIITTLPDAFCLLSIHHGPLAFAGFAFVAMLFFNFYFFVLDKRIEKLHHILKIVIQIIYVFVAFILLYWLMQKK